VKCDALYNAFDNIIELFSRAETDPLRRVAKDTIFETLKPDMEKSINKICNDINMDAIEPAIPNFDAVLRHIFYVAVAKKIKEAGL